jgi:hypothetical protein
MVVGSNVNPNYPIPGIDQSSKGFRDNFSTIKVEIENLQSKNIVLQGDATGNAIIDSGTGDIVINTIVSVSNIAAASPNRSVQFNNGGVLDGTARLQWDNGSVLVIGTQTPDSYYWLDAGQTKIHNELLIYSDVGSSLFTIASAFAQNPTIAINSVDNNNVGMANINISNADTVTNDPLNIQFNGVTAAVFNATGLAVGALVNSTTVQPATSLEVYTDSQASIATFYNAFPNSDNGIRITTVDSNSTAGVVLQQSSADSVVGIRVGQTGNFTIHTGLNNGAELSDSSQVVTVDPTGQVGIGIPAPQTRLDVDGGMQWTLPNTANAAPQSTNPVGVVVDDWTLSQYRSADYTLQVTAPSGAVEITKFVVMHEAGVAYQYIYANLNNGGGDLGPTTLGTISADLNGSVMEITYSGNVSNTVVKLDATYITI